MKQKIKDIPVDTRFKKENDPVIWKIDTKTTDIAVDRLIRIVSEAGTLATWIPADTEVEVVELNYQKAVDTIDWDKFHEENSGPRQEVKAVDEQELVTRQGDPSTPWMLERKNTHIPDPIQTGHSYPGPTEWSVQKEYNPATVKPEDPEWLQQIIKQNEDVIKNEMRNHWQYWEQWFHIEQARRRGSDNDVENK